MRTRCRSPRRRTQLVLWVAAVAVLAADSVNVVTRFVPVIVAGRNVAVTPVGTFSAESVTSPVKVPIRLITMGIVVAAP